MPDQRAQNEALAHVMLAYRLVSEGVLFSPVPPAWLAQLRRIDGRLDLDALLTFAGPRHATGPMTSTKSMTVSRHSG